MLLSAGGKIQNSSSMLCAVSSLPIHLMSIIEMPKVVIKLIEHIFSDFLWGNGEGKKKHWVARALV